MIVSPPAPAVLPTVVAIVVPSTLIVSPPSFELSLTLSVCVLERKKGVPPS